MQLPTPFSFPNKNVDVDGRFFSLSAILAHATITSADGHEERVVVGDWAPLLFISESKYEFLVEAELTAVKPEALRIIVGQGVLAITGEIDFADRPGIECECGCFSRSILLPGNIDTSRIDCQLNQGLLQVHLPKKSASAMEIDI